MFITVLARRVDALVAVVCEASVTASLSDTLVTAYPGQAGADPLPPLVDRLGSHLTHIPASRTRRLDAKTAPREALVPVVAARLGLDPFGTPAQVTAALMVLGATADDRARETGRSV